MPKNEKYEELLKDLDKILSYLVNDTQDYKVNFYKMSEDVFKLEKNKVENEKTETTEFEALVKEIIDSYKLPFEKTKNLRLATLHLHSEGLITIDKDYILEITFKGLLTYSEGVVNKFKTESKISQQLHNLRDEQLRQAVRMTKATEEMNKTNKSIRSLTRWIVFGALVSAIYYILEIFSLRICFCN